MNEALSTEFDSEDIERQLAVKLTNTALEGDGSVPAARQVLEVLDRIRTRQAAEEHKRQMGEISNQPIELARYLGYLGETVKGVEQCIGHRMDGEERSAFQEGQRRRHLEIRAVELDRAVRGQGKPAPWMRQS